MRWFIATFISLLTLASQAQAQMAEVLMACTVKHQELTLASGGKTSTFVGFEDYFDKGDTLRLKIQTLYQGDLYLELADTSTEKIYLDHSTKATDNQTVKLVDIYGVVVLDFAGDGDDYLTMTAEEIQVKDRGRLLSFKRYYENNFDGMLVMHNPQTLFIQVATFDCRMIKDEFDQIFAAFEGR